jgi:hypothetical protein
MQDIAVVDDGLSVPLQVRDNCHQLAMERLHWLSNRRATKAGMRNGPTIRNFFGCRELCTSDNQTKPSSHDFRTCSAGEKPTRATKIPRTGGDEGTTTKEFIRISSLCANERQNPIRLPLLGALLLAIATSLGFTVASLAHDRTSISISLDQKVSDHSCLSRRSNTSITGEPAMLPHRARSWQGSESSSPMTISVAMFRNIFIFLKLVAALHGTNQLRNGGKFDKLQRGISFLVVLTVCIHLGTLSWNALCLCFFLIAFLYVGWASAQRINPVTPANIITQVRTCAYIHVHTLSARGICNYGAVHGLHHPDQRIYVFLCACFCACLFAFVHAYVLGTGKRA